MKKYIIPFVAAIFAASISFAGIPTLVGHVNDNVGKLNKDQIRSLEDKLSNEEKESSNQIVILITKSLDGKDIKSYSYDVAKAWQIGQKGKDNGVLLVVAPNERKVRIEVGYGLEGKLPDIRCKEITDAASANFKKWEWYNGISTSADSIIKSINGEFKNSPSKASVLPSGLGWKIPLIVAILILYILIAFGTGDPFWIFVLIMAMSGSDTSSSSNSYSGGGGNFGGGGSDSSF